MSESSSLCSYLCSLGLSLIGNTGSYGSGALAPNSGAATASIALGRLPMCITPPMTSKRVERSRRGRCSRQASKYFARRIDERHRGDLIGPGKRREGCEGLFV